MMVAIAGAGMLTGGALMHSGLSDALFVAGTLTIIFVAVFAFVESEMQD